MNNTPNFYKDILISVFYFSGLAGLTAGDILFSVALILVASLLSYFNIR